MRCENCLYYYREEGETFPVCHFNNEGWGVAPCEEEDDWDYNLYDETEMTYDELDYEP